MTFQGPLSVRPFEVRGSNPIRRVPSGHLMFLSSQLLGRLPCPPLQVPPGQKGASPRAEPLRTLPVSTFPSSCALVLIRIFWLTRAAPAEVAWASVAGVSPSPQPARPAAVTPNARTSRPVRRGCRGTVPDISSIETPSSSRCRRLHERASHECAPQTAALRQQEQRPGPSLTVASWTRRSTVADALATRRRRAVARYRGGYGLALTTSVSAARSPSRRWLGVARTVMKPTR